MTTPVMPQITTIVFLMLENRSLDNVLGWLYRTRAPAVVFPKGSNPDFDGIPADASNTHRNKTYSPSVGTGGNQPCRVPQFDPGEPLSDVAVQLYADGHGHMPPGDVWSQTPQMQGFAYSYYAVYDSPQQVMGAYDAAQLPILYGLASNFAVSDAWFSSVPTQTNPNRAFSVCGTSLGAVVNADIDEETYANTNTIFNVLGDAGKSWGLYWQFRIAREHSPIHWQPFTSSYFTKMNSAPNGTVADGATFMAAAKAGTLPDFCYLEPYWGGGKGNALDADSWFGIQGNDYHPPAWIGPAEADLNALYETLVASPQWPNMLLIITFDEHGGSYDHVPPPTCVAPDEHVSSTGFDFTRLGVRVPAILVSPYVQAGTVFRAEFGHFDHTSVLATLCKWAGVDPAAANLGARVAAAPTFENVLRSTARTDTPHFTLPDGYASQGGGTGALAPLGLTLPAASPVQLNIHSFRHIVDSSDTAHFASWFKQLLSGD